MTDYQRLSASYARLAERELLHAEVRACARVLLDDIEREEDETERELFVRTNCPVCTVGVAGSAATVCARHGLELALAQLREAP